MFSREREAVQEAYNLLNEYADKLYGPEAKKVKGIVPCIKTERFFLNWKIFKNLIKILNLSKWREMVGNGG